ncbi:Mechanosensory abnormality MEC-17-like protein [Giardia lamblia P15]|uniref:Alpha-tubulin N-acetyltransferase n=1 Tax=Giardia intestinalis (strain P15) TaxID=658858 RepID=E1EX84_GIAIA|nr:Mechanosensory abnormality MEC-17-like protein [Giardia lamblia P15]
MQFGFSVAEAIGLQRSGVALLTDQSLRSMPLSQQKKVEIILDGMGRGSQAAQGLPSPVTNLAFIRDSHHFLFLAVDEDRCLGILKGGVKHLFMLDSQNETHEMDAMCCLDFYTHETVQRRGIGTRLFRAMELHTHISAHGWAFDRPSSKLLAFLSKVYGMQDFKAQSNNFFMLDASIRLWGAEFKQYRRSKKHYIPDAYLLPETQECEYLGEAELTKRTPLRRSMVVDLQPETARSEDTQPRALTADELLSKRSIVLPTASRTPSLPDQPQSVAAAYMNKRIEEACPNFEQYMRDHYGAKSLIVPPGMQTPSSHSQDSVSQEDMIQRQWQLDRMAFVLARETNARGSIHSTIGRGATSGRRG